MSAAFHTGAIRCFRRGSVEIVPRMTMEINLSYWGITVVRGVQRHSRKGLWRAVARFIGLCVRHI
jgi:hypothetical protein